MATRKAKPPVAKAEPQDDAPAPTESEGKIKVKRKRRRLYDPVPEQGAAEPAPVAADAAAPEPAKKKARKRPARARQRKPQASAATAKVPATVETPATTEAPEPSGTESSRPAASDRAARAASAKELVKKYSLGTAAVGLLPLPLVDLIALSVLQGKMLKDLSKIYRVTYSEQRAKIYISALLGSITSISVARQSCLLVGSLLKSVPAVGLVAGSAVMPAASGASTYALGKVFIQHFESGGTLLDFDAEKMRAYYELQVAKAQAQPQS